MKMRSLNISQFHPDDTWPRLDYEDDITHDVAFSHVMPVVRVIGRVNDAVFYKLADRVAPIRWRP